MRVISALSDFESEINKPTLVVVDYFATWCGPCVAIAPFFESLAAKYPTVTFFKVDVDEAEEISTKQNVNAMPTFQFFKGGNKVGELVGANKDQLEALIVQHSG